MAKGCWKTRLQEDLESRLKEVMHEFELRELGFAYLKNNGQESYVLISENEVVRYDLLNLIRGRKYFKFASRTSHPLDE